MAKEFATTEFTVVLAAFIATLRRYTTQDDIIVGVPVACRSMRQTNGVIGCLCNTVALRTRFSPRQSFSDLVEATALTLSEAMTHQDLPFDQVVDALAQPRS